MENYKNYPYTNYTKSEIIMIEDAIITAASVLDMADCLLNTFYCEYFADRSLDHLKACSERCPDAVRMPIETVQHLITEALGELNVFGDPDHYAVQFALRSAEQKKRIIKTLQEH